jgi:iron complex outermembrane receptor protein
VEGQTMTLAEFEVVAEQTMSGQAVAMNEQRHAANIKNVVSFDELGDRGQENIGDYVRFLPGVTILDDGENPGRIALGGFPAEMSNIQIDGVDVAATGIGATSSRAAALQDVPILNIDRVEVSKVPTPDQPASGLGGSMNLIAKTGTGIKRPIGRYQVYMNFSNVDGLDFGGGSRQPHDRASPRHKEPSLQHELRLPGGEETLRQPGCVPLLASAADGRHALGSRLLESKEHLPDDQRAEGFRARDHPMAPGGLDFPDREPPVGRGLETVQP